LAEQRELEREAQLALEAEQRAIAEAEAQERERVRILNSLPDEPDAADKSAVALQFRLPDGRQVARRFSGTEPLATIFVYLGTQELKDTAGETIKQWELIAHYPKRALTDRTQTLKDAGLVGRAVLFVQEVVG
jgi:phosphomannomutase